MITQLRENESYMKKLEIILGICSNTRENLENMILKYSNGIYLEKGIKEDLILVSSNLDAVMKLVDPIFKLYYVLPSNTENENVPLFLNTRKSDNLLKYEGLLLEKTNSTERTTENAYYNMNIDTSVSPNPNWNGSDSNEVNNKIKENMNTISKILSDKLKKRGKDFTSRFTVKKEERPVLPNMDDKFNSLKKSLNK